jgi:hypothetical protein
LWQNNYLLFLSASQTNLELIKSIKPGFTEDNFRNSFQQIYGFSLNEKNLEKFT